MEGIEMDTLPVIVPYLDGRTLVRCLGLSTLLRDRILEMDTPLVRTYRLIKSHDLTTSWDINSIEDRGLFSLALSFRGIADYFSPNAYQSEGFGGEVALHCPKRLLSVLASLHNSHGPGLVASLRSSRIRKRIEERMARDEEYAEAFLAFAKATPCLRPRIPESMWIDFYSDKRMRALAEDPKRKCNFRTRYTARLRQGITEPLGVCSCGSSDPSHVCDREPLPYRCYFEDALASGSEEVVRCVLHRDPEIAEESIISKKVISRYVRRPNLRPIIDGLISPRDREEFDTRVILFSTVGSEAYKVIDNGLYMSDIETLIKALASTREKVPLPLPTREELENDFDSNWGYSNLTDQDHAMRVVLPLLLGRPLTLPPLPGWNVNGEIERRAMMNMNVFNSLVGSDPSDLLSAGVKYRSKAVCELALRLGAKVTDVVLTQAEPIEWLIDLLRQWRSTQK